VLQAPGDNVRHLAVRPSLMWGISSANAPPRKLVIVVVWRGPMQPVLAALLLTLDIAASWVPTAPALRPRHDTHTRRAASTTRRAASITAAVGGGARLVYCEGLSKSYDGQRFQFRDISLGVATGQRVGLIGVNGVGKSTLMKCLAGLEQHDAGSKLGRSRP
jgi:ABC-type glutathione transport system ATPase component